MLKEWRLAITLLLRECRAGQWLIVLFALILAVTTITAIDFFTNRLARGLDKQSAQLLGGDLVISSASPIPVTWQQHAKDLSLRTAVVLIFPSVVSANNKLQLVNVQAVSKEYPLFGKSIQLNHHAILSEYRLLPLLSIQTGDAMTIGAASFVIQDILSGDIDMVNTGWIIAPRVLMRLDDVPSTKVILPGSRVNYRLLMTGDPENIQSFRAWITPQLKADQSVVDAASQRNTLMHSLQNADKYIQLVILFCLLMCGTAITLSVRQHMHRHYEDVALWRCLVRHKNRGLGTFIRQFIMIAFAAGAAGTIAGFL